MRVSWNSGFVNPSYRTAPNFLTGFTGLRGLTACYPVNPVNPVKKSVNWEMPKFTVLRGRCA